MTKLFHKRTYVNYIFRYFMRLQNWVSLGHYDNVYKLKVSAEALIEVAESDHCGSVGGFDEGQTEKDRKNLARRFMWLLDAHQIDINDTDFVNEEDRQKVIEAIDVVDQLDIK